MLAVLCTHEGLFKKMVSEQYINRNCFIKVREYYKELILIMGIVICLTNKATITISNEFINLTGIRGKGALTHIMCGTECSQRQSMYWTHEVLSK